jgi:hypothetical protein
MLGDIEFEPNALVYMNQMLVVDTDAALRIQHLGRKSIVQVVTSTER